MRNFIVLTLPYLCALAIAEEYVVHHPIEHNKTAIIRKNEDGNYALIFNTTVEIVISIVNITFTPENHLIHCETPGGYIALPMLNRPHKCVNCHFDLFNNLEELVGSDPERVGSDPGLGGCD